MRAGRAGGADPFRAIAERSGVRSYDIEELVLDHAALDAIPEGSLAAFPNLQCLFVPFNKLKSLCHLEGNLRLKLIDARSNLLVEVDLSHQQFVTELLLADNLLRDFDTFMGKIGHMRDLETLDVRGNPLCQGRGFRHRVIAKFAHLKVLNGVDVTVKERNRSTRLIPHETIRLRAQSMLDYLKTRPLCEADSVVGRKAETIRRGREERRRRELEESTAVARQRRDAFEAASAARSLPVPVWLQPREVPAEPKREGGQQRTAATRMFLKRAQWRDLDITPPDQEFVLGLNPGFTDKALKRAVDYSIRYPTFG
jgi:hypothetical protein